MYYAGVPEYDVGKFRYDAEKMKFRAGISATRAVAPQRRSAVPK